MDFELDEDQGAILEAVRSLLAQHAGPARAIALDAKGELDGDLRGAMVEAGFLDVARGDGPGALAAALVVQAVAEAAGRIPVGAEALVAPALGLEAVPGPVALADASRPALARYAAQARTLLVVDGDEARCLPLEPGSVAPVASNFGFPMGRLEASRLGGGRSLGPGSGPRLQAWWRVAVAVEATGTMSAALDHCVGYVSERRQFGRAIGSFQGVQHRLARLKIGVEGSRWLALEAAHRGAPEEEAAAAAAHACATAREVFRDTHQLSGAIGFTREHDLHVWSMRLKALELELGGLSALRRAVARERWGGGGRR